MILVTVGTHHEGFNRLVLAADSYAESNTERVVIQRGSSTYLPRFAQFFDFTNYKIMKQLIEEARVVVMHAAAGSILMGLTMEKPLVLAPRLREFRENYNDHQLELAEALEQSNQAVVCEPVSAEGLVIAIDTASRQLRKPAGPSELVANLRQYLTVLESGKQSD